MANDQDNLYFRFDMRGTPTQRLGAGTLYRYFYIYVNTDDNNATGDLLRGGADYEVDITFYTENYQIRLLQLLQIHRNRPGLELGLV